MKAVKNLILNGIDKGLDFLNFIQDRFSNENYEKFKNRENIKKENVEELMNFNELANSKGYLVEDHEVITEDGYILKLHRLILPKEKEEKNSNSNPNSNTNLDNKSQSILLMHGIFDSSEGWILNDKENSVAFKLTNSGYDVWLGNSRGNKYSRNHKFLKEVEIKDKNKNKNKISNSQENINYSFFINVEESKITRKLKDEFWNFSFEEMGKYDIPAFIEYIQKIKKSEKKLIYIGHSQGTVQLFSALTENLDYFKSKIKLFLALAPVGKTTNLDSPIYDLLDISQMDFIANSIGFTELFPYNEKLNKFTFKLFRSFPILAEFGIEIIGDKKSSEINNLKRIPIFMSHIPSGSSLKALLHLVQMFRKDKFQKYDYGIENNKKIYGTEKVAEYDLGKIKDFPIALFSGENDRLAHPKDVEWLAENLKETLIYSKSFEKMGHMSFQISNNLNWFEKGMSLIEEYKDKE